MGKIRRGGYIFVTWSGDHGRHVHVFKDGAPVVKWDLDENRPIEGRAGRKVKRLIRELQAEGLL